MGWSDLVPELAVSDLEQSLRFYTELIGFRVRFRREPWFAYLEHGLAQLMLEQCPPSWPVGELERPYGRGLNLQIEWPDVRALRERLRGANYPLCREIEEVWRQTGEARTGSQEFLVQDPDGYLLRFSKGLGEQVSMAPERSEP